MNASETLARAQELATATHADVVVKTKVSSAVEAHARAWLYPIKCLRNHMEKASELGLLDGITVEDLIPLLLQAAPDKARALSLEKGNSQLPPYLKVLFDLT